MTTDVELERLKEALGEVQEALKAIISENATHVEFDGRTITRPALGELEEQETRLKILINDRIAKGIGGDYLFGRRVRYK